MDDKNNFSTSGPIRSVSVRRMIAAAALAITVAACGGDSVPDSLAQVDESPATSDFAAAELASQPELGNEVLSVDAVAVTAVLPDPVPVPMTTTAVPAASTTTVVAEQAEPAELNVLTPEDIEGSYADERTGLRVLTAVDDPLNVRTGPGPDHDVITRLAHETDNIVATHGFNISQGVTWLYIEQNGEAIGWVHADFLFGQGPAATCQAGPDFPEFEGATVFGTGDVDLDGLLDEVFVLAESNQVGVSAAGFPVVEYDAWVLASFGNGGVATGQWTGYFEPAPANALHIFDLTTLNPANDFNEIVFPVGQGASHGQWGVMTLDGCSLVPTTLDSTPFSFSHGASAGHSTVGGCEYGPHGEIEFSISSRDFNTGEWVMTTYQLNGTDWLDLGTLTGTVTDPSDFPYAPNLTDCAGVS